MAENMGAGTRGVLPALTGIRFFAALGVLVYHFTVRASWPAPLRALGNRGWLGVPLFFVLSGFVLAYNYFPQEEAGRFRRRGFWIARLARIYPVYLAAWCAQGVYDCIELHRGALGFTAWAGSGVSSLLLMHDWVPAWSMAWNQPGWTLSVEFFFYLLFPVFLFIGRLRRGRAWSLAIAMAAATAVGISRSSPHGGRMPAIYLPMFLAGMAMARLYGIGSAGRVFRAAAGPAVAACIVILTWPGMPLSVLAGLAAALTGTACLCRGLRPRRLPLVGSPSAA